MGLLQKATVEQAAAKVGLFGKQGSGKTTTAALLAIGLSKTYHNGAPVAFQDTENGSDYLVPIFRAEGIELFVIKSRAFLDMREGEREAKAAGCCAELIDSYSHPWTELVQSFVQKSKQKKLQFHHQAELKSIWQEWTDQMLASPMHMLLCGRLGYDWDREADEEDGTKGELVKLGTKMKGEGDAGYEPSLLVELEALQAEAGRVRKTRSKKSTITHYAYVLKDRWRTLNGRTISFKDITNYKPGDWETVFNAFRPHFDQLAIGKTTQRAIDAGRTSKSLFSEPGEFGKRRTIALEELQGAIVAVWPGQDAGSKAAKALIVQALFDTRSWAKVETLRVEQLEDAVAVLHEFEKQAKADPGLVDGETAIRALLQLAQDSVARESVADSTPEEEPVL